MDNKRNSLISCERVVVKVGTRSLVQRSGRPDQRRISALVRSISELKKAGREVILVTSGAVGSGMEALGLKRKPKDISGLQMCAAVGQSRLMALYDKFFAAQGVKVGQVLLTHDDLKNRKRHLNARNTMMRLLREGIVPVVNENDVVAVDEIKVGDNDVLASLVALLVEADLLVLLSTTDGLKRPTSSRRMQRISRVDSLNAEILALAKGKGSELSTGGMFTKLKAAENALRGGIKVVIADGRKAGVLQRVLAGEDTGTYFGSESESEPRKMSSRKKWIAFFGKTQGGIVVDAGAALALAEKGKSLLPVGVFAVQGDFEAGAVVNVVSRSGDLLGRGLVSYSSEDIKKIQGIPSARIGQILGSMHDEEVIHRDNMVLLK